MASIGDENDRKIIVWNLETNEIVGKCFIKAVNLTDIVVSSDNSWILTVGAEGHIMLWEFEISKEGTI